VLHAVGKNEDENDHILDSFAIVSGCLGYAIIYAYATRV